MYPYFVGLDVHKHVIAYCVKTLDGKIVMEGKIKTDRESLTEWVKLLPGPWHGGMEATMFSHWLYYYLKPYAARLEMGHAFRMKAITAGKKKSDKIDARTIADLLRCNLFPACFVIPPALGALRQMLRFRRMVVQETVKFKNKTAGLLMEAGVEYERRRLHGKRYFKDLVENNEWIGESMRPLLAFNREQIESLQDMDGRLIRTLEQHPLLQARVEALQSIDGVGPVTALSWALETATPQRFASAAAAMSYCGLTSALRESAGQQKRSPLSKQRNGHLQSVLIEAAKIAPMLNERLKQVHAKATSQGGHPNRATVAVARKLVTYLLAVDRAFLARHGESMIA
jgi:Transposase and inactivated derivatives